MEDNNIRGFLVIKTQDNRYITKFNSSIVEANTTEISDALLFPQDLTYNEYIDTMITLKNNGYSKAEFILIFKEQ